MATHHLVLVVTFDGATARTARPIIHDVRGIAPRAFRAGDLSVCNLVTGRESTVRVDPGI